jgi:hypothetical protein
VLAALAVVVIVTVAGCSTITRGPSRSVQLPQTPTTVSVGMGAVAPTSSTTSCGTPPSVGTLPPDQQTDIIGPGGEILHYVPPGPMTYNCGVSTHPPSPPITPPPGEPLTLKP